MTIDDLKLKIYLEFYLHHVIVDVSFYGSYREFQERKIQIAKFS